MIPEVNTIIKYNENESYALFSNQSNVPKHIRNLTPNEAKQIIEANRVLYIFQNYFSRLYEAELNLWEFAKVADHRYSHNINPKSNLLIYDISVSLVNANRLCTNFINSWRSFIELMYKQVSNSYGGEKSMQFLEIKKFTKALYDENFEYRLLTGLRNFGAHYDSIISGIFTMNGVTSTLLSKNHMQDFKDFREKEVFRKDFEQLPNQIDVIPVLHKGMEHLYLLLNKLLEINKAYFLKYSKLFIDMPDINHYENLGFGKLILSEPLYLQELPVAVAKKVINFYKDPIDFK